MNEMIEFDEDALDLELDKLVTLASLYQKPDLTTILGNTEKATLSWIDPLRIAELVATGYTITQIADSIRVPARYLSLYYQKTVDADTRAHAEELRADALRTQIEAVMDNLDVRFTSNAKLIISTKLRLMEADNAGKYGSKNNSGGANVNINSGTTLIIEDNTQTVRVEKDVIQGEVVDGESAYLKQRYEEQRARLRLGQDGPSIDEED